jgi:hypothetical protein
MSNTFEAQTPLRQRQTDAFTGEQQEIPATTAERVKRPYEPE